MGEVGNAISNLILEKGQAGPEMTHGLKVLGNGNMHDGIKRLAAFFLEEGRQNGYKLGERTGVIKGSIGTLVVGTVVAGGIFVKSQYKKYVSEKAHEEEGKKILNILQQDVNDKETEMMES